jgi:hypothetical protein
MIGRCKPFEHLLGIFFPALRSISFGLKVSKLVVHTGGRDWSSTREGGDAYLGLSTESVKTQQNRHFEEKRI